MFAVGDENGLTREWRTQWGGDVYRTEAAEWDGDIPWASLHEAVRREDHSRGAWTNRGLVLRGWKARLGGKAVSLWFAEFKLSGGVGYDPVSFTYLNSNEGYLLKIDDRPFDQAMHGNDFWQTDYDAATQRWSRTHNFPATDAERSVRFAPAQKRDQPE